MPNLRIEQRTIAEVRAAGIEDTLALNWEEIEHEQTRVPLAINWDAYRSLERIGVLKIFCLYDGDDWIGYSVFFVQPTLHHSLTKWAVNDLVYIEPHARKGWAGVFLVRETEKRLRDLGAQVISYNVKPTQEPGDLGYKRGRDSVGRLLSKLGYRLAEQAWAKLI